MQQTITKLAYILSICSSLYYLITIYMTEYQSLNSTVLVADSPFPMDLISIEIKLLSFAGNIVLDKGIC